jgi:hypothetical protein
MTIRQGESAGSGIASRANNVFPRFHESIIILVVGFGTAKSGANCGIPSIPLKNSLSEA